MAKKLPMVPKRIAGIKIPRQLRKGPLGSILGTPAGQILLAELLVVIGGAIATAANPGTKTGRALRQAMNEGLQELKGGHTGKRRKRDMARHLGDGLVRGLDAFRHSMREDADLDLKEAEPMGRGKKRIRRGQEVRNRRATRREDSEAKAEGQVGPTR